MKSLSQKTMAREAVGTAFAEKFTKIAHRHYDGPALAELVWREGSSNNLAAELGVAFCTPRDIENP